MRDQSESIKLNNFSKSWWLKVFIPLIKNSKSIFLYKSMFFDKERTITERLAVHFTFEHENV